MATTWTLSSNNYSIVIPAWSRLKLRSPGEKRGGIPIVAVAVVNETTGQAYFYTTINNVNFVKRVLLAITEGFQIPAGTSKNWQEWGVWSSSAALHPLHAATEKKLKSWVKTLRYEGDGMEFHHNALIKLPPLSIRKNNGVSYEGYTNRFLKVHSFATITKLIDDGLRLAKDAWGWQPKNLRVLSHSVGNSMGIAFSPGKGIHRISLHAKLLNEYDTMSIFRTVLHEFCHHHREERWPRQRMNDVTAHDERFCDELAKVDPLVRDDPKSCRFFTDQQWEGSKVVQAKKAQMAPSNYDPAKGNFVLRVLKNGELRLDWKGKPGTFQKRGIKVNGRVLPDLVEGMSRQQQKSLAIEPSDYRSAAALLHFLTIKTPSGAKQEMEPNLHGFLLGLQAKYPSMKELAA